MQPKIVFLDRYCIGQTDTSSLKELGHYIEYDYLMSCEQVLSHSQGVDVLITNKARITREMMLQLPSLKLISVAATGVNHVDVDADDWVEPDYLAAFFHTPLPDPHQNDRVMVIQDILLDYSQAPEPQPANSRIFNYTSATLQRAESNNTQLAIQQQFFNDGYTSSKLYTTSLLHRYNLRFPEDISLSEDHLFFFAVLHHIDTVIWLSDAKLHYMQRGNFNQNLGSRIYPSLSYIRFSQLFKVGLESLIERFSIDHGPYIINLYRISVLHCCMIAC